MHVNAVLIITAALFGLIAILRTRRATDAIRRSRSTILIVFVVVLNIAVLVAMLTPRFRQGPWGWLLLIVSLVGDAMMCAWPRPFGRRDNERAKAGGGSGRN